MSLNKAPYVGQGCIVEFLNGNTIVIAFVLEEQAGRLRLYTQNKKEVKYSLNRILPWVGPTHSASSSREEIDGYLENYRNKRLLLQKEIIVQDVWELAQGEVSKASAAWFSSLVWDNPTIDHEAAMGRALIESKTHFNFSPPEFKIFDEETVTQRLAEIEATRLREALITKGNSFFYTLWGIYTTKGKQLSKEDIPEPNFASILQEMLFQRLSGQDTTDDSMWKLLVKGLPAEQHLALCLAQAWGLIPEHYNFLLDKADYAHGESWATSFATHLEKLKEDTQKAMEKISYFDARKNATSKCLLDDRIDPQGMPAFVSIDPATTKDRDDAFFVCELEDGSYRVIVVIACPTISWDFGSTFDKQTLRRASSLYLPEGDEHMIPKKIGCELFSLDEGKDRLGFILDMHLDSEGKLLNIVPEIAKIRMQNNLSLEESECVFLQKEVDSHNSPSWLIPTFDTLEEPITSQKLVTNQTESSSPPYAKMLTTAHSLSKKLQKIRIESGAVIIERPEPEITLSGNNKDVNVSINLTSPADISHFIVGEIMILANSAIGEWAKEHAIPLLYRTQDVALPKEFSGVWSEPHEIARVVRFLPSAILESQPKRHAGLGIQAYATVTSPIRRYTDLLNQGQLVHYLLQGTPLYSSEELTSLLPLLNSRLDAVSQVQRFRPRYWKLLFFKQKGDKIWWNGIVTEENDNIVTVALPWAQMILRGKRKLFDERVHPGQRVKVRINKVNPLMNTISILEVQEDFEDN